MVLCLFLALSVNQVWTFFNSWATSDHWDFSKSVTLIYHSFIHEAFYMKKLYFFVTVSNVPVKLIALALLTSMSMPPNVFTASWTALKIAPSLRMSTAQGRHFPPASSTISKIIPISYTVHLVKPSVGLLMCAMFQVALLYHGGGGGGRG